jgi:hypothetical protein
MAAGQGFEPWRTDPESVVLPLHHPAVSGIDPARIIIIQAYIVVKGKVVFLVSLTVLPQTFVRPECADRRYFAPKRP